MSKKKLSSFEHFIQDLRIISLHTSETHKKVAKMILLELANLANMDQWHSG